MDPNRCVPGDVWQAAKSRAGADGTTVTAVTVAALRAYGGEPAPLPDDLVRLAREITAEAGIDVPPEFAEILGDRWRRCVFAVEVPLRGERGPDPAGRRSSTDSPGHG